MEDSTGIPTKYDNRVHHYRKAWGALIPTHIKIQYAGGMGMFSAGVGWDYGKHGQWETDLMFGFIAKHSRHASEPMFSSDSDGGLTSHIHAVISSKAYRFSMN